MKARHKIWIKYVQISSEVSFGAEIFHIERAVSDVDRIIDQCMHSVRLLLYYKSFETVAE